MILLTALEDICKILRGEKLKPVTDEEFNRFCYKKSDVDAITAEAIDNFETNKAELDLE